MSLLDFLRPQGAQAPGAMSQPNPLANFLSSGAGMAMAGQLLGNQGNAANFGNALTVGGLAMGKQKELLAQTAKENQTKAWFEKNAPEYMPLFDAGLPAKDIAETYAKQRYAKEKGQGIINAGAGNLYDSEKGEWLSAPGGGAEGIAGLTPVYLRDKNTGKLVVGQMTKDGKILRSQLPEGDFEALGPYEKSFETNKGAKAGEMAGAAAGALPGATQMAAKVQQQVNDLKNDPYLPRMLGPVDSRLPNVTSDSARVQGRIEQLSGEAFLAARQALKGGGAITDLEGQRAEAALARMKTAQSEADFKQALDEFNYHVQLGLQMLQEQAGQGAPQAPGYGAPAAPQAPQGGGVVDYTDYF